MVYYVIIQQSCGQDHKLQDQGQAKKNLIVKTGFQEQVKTKTNIFEWTPRLAQLKIEEDNITKFESIILSYSTSLLLFLLHFVYDVIIQTSCDQDHTLKTKAVVKNSVVKTDFQDQVKTKTKIFAWTARLVQLTRGEEYNTTRFEAIVHVIFIVIITFGI